MDSIIDVNLSREIGTLNHKFLLATKRFGNRNNAGTKLHELQVDFAHKINNLKYAPDYIMTKLIHNTYLFIYDIDNVTMD